MNETTNTGGLSAAGDILASLQAIDSTLLTEFGIGAALLLLAVWLTHLLSRKVALKAVVKFAEKSSIKWDDILVEKKVFHRLVPVAPLIFLQLGVAFVPHIPLQAAELIETVALCLIVLFSARAIAALLTSCNEIYERYSPSASRPIKGYIQVVQVLTYIVAGLLIISFLVGRSPMILLSGLGAMTAVLMLIFRDTLLSLVAGIQLTQNDLIRVGDWIEMPQFGADGDVVEVALNVVRVQNWDRTFTMVPTHKFIEHSFKNWRGMSESGGRRIKRAINLDMSTIRFLTDSEIEKLRSIAVLRDYIDAKLRDIETYNKTHLPEGSKAPTINGRRLTNVGTFRAYITAYLRKHSGVRQDMIFLIRQLEPTPKGLPLEVYVFCSDIRWVQYEGIQADIFDHLLAVVPEFGLRVFQEPSGADFARLTAPDNSTPSNAPDTEPKKAPALPV